MHEFETPAGWLSTHGVSPTRDRAALSCRDRVTLVEADGSVLWSVRHPEWGRGDSESGSCAFSLDGRLVWATVPSDDGPDRWWVIDAASGEVLGGTQLGCYAAGSHVIHHLGGEWVGLSVGEGQDGSEIYWARWDHGVDIARLDDRTRVLAAVNPDGESYLATPHDTSPVTVHAFPHGDVLARLDSDQLTGDCWFDFDGCYVDSRRLLVKVINGADDITTTHVADAASLTGLEPVEYDDPGVEAPDMSLFAGGDGTWLTIRWPEPILTRWRLD